MRQSKWLAVLLILTLFMTACANGGSKDQKASTKTADKKLTKEEVLTKTDEKGQKMKNYKLKIGLGVIVVTNGVTQSEQHVRGDAEYVAKDSPDIHAKYVTKTKDQPDTNFEIYKVGDQMIVNAGSGWQNATDDMKNQELLKATYPVMTGVLKDVKDDVKMEETDGEYVITYSGNEQKVYQAFQEPFSIKFNGVDTSNIESELEAKIDKNSMQLKSLSYSATAKNNNSQKVKISSDINYNDFNHVKVEIPNEVQSGMQ